MARQPISFTLIVEDESIFTYDVKIRAVWAIKGSKPRILTTGSHRKTCWFGALAEDGTQLFRQCPKAEIGSKFYDSFEDFKKAGEKYYRTKRFNLDLYKYLCH